VLNSEIRRKLQNLRSPSAVPPERACDSAPAETLPAPEVVRAAPEPPVGRLGRLRGRLGLAQGGPGQVQRGYEPGRPVLGGDELRTGLGSLLVLRADHDAGPGEAFARALPHLSAREFAPVRHLGPGDFAFMDTETAGLRDAPLFLVGILRYTDCGWETVQLLARDYDEELALLVEAARLLGQHSVLVTFNGLTFDVPFIRTRMRYHRLRPLYDPGHHVDLLKLARRQYARALPNCQLQTLEARLLGLARAGDIPGAEVPRVYHEFVAGGGKDMLAVLEHNRLDLLALLRLAPLLGRPEGETLQ
jgi:hypothetical protein